VELERIESMKRTELQAAAVGRFGKEASKWVGPATNVELREALTSGTVPARFANGNGNGVDLATAIATAIGPLVTGELDEDRVREIVDGRVEALEARLAAQRTVIDVKLPSGEVRTVGRQHREFPTLLALVAQGESVFMVGPAGSFKTSAAKAVATALKLPFACESMSQQTSTSQLLGYMDAHGRYVRSKLREAYENGGVYLMDEIDNGNANVIAVLNAALANGECGFPDGMIPRHENFRFIAAGNTKGMGADRKFVGRNQLDGASLDRFALLVWDYDEDFERDLVGEDMWEWVTYVQQVRRVAAQHGIADRTVLATPRASLGGAKMLRSGMPRERVEELFLWNKLGADDRNRILANLR
jgi:MoxR-like ATPase